MPYTVKSISNNSCKKCYQIHYFAQKKKGMFSSYPLKYIKHPDQNILKKEYNDAYKNIALSSLLCLMF